MTIQFPTSHSVCFCTTWEKKTAKYALKCTKNVNKNIPDTIGRNLKNDYQI